MVAEAERVVTELEDEVSSKLTAAEAKTLLLLLQKSLSVTYFSGVLGL